MSRARILYLDVPFENESGGDKNRSRFLFHALRENFEVDLLLIGSEGASAKPAWTGCLPMVALAAALRLQPWWASGSNTILLLGEGALVGAVGIAGLWRFGLTAADREKMTSKLGRKFGAKAKGVSK